MGSEGLPKYFTPTEVAEHNAAEDLWVSFLGKVFKLSPLVEANQGDVLMKPILAAAGTDISHWFNAKTGNVRMHIDKTTGLEIPFTPFGRFLHCPPSCPRADFSTDFGLPWWKDESYCLGSLSAKTRLIKITNILSSMSQIIEVCNEEVLTQIRDRYLRYNIHATSYTWKHLGRLLDMDKTLADNGIPDESEDFHELSIDRHEFIPELHVYFDDDLTEF